MSCVILHCMFRTSLNMGSLCDRSLLFSVHEPVRAVSYIWLLAMNYLQVTNLLLLVEYLLHTLQSWYLTRS